MSRSSVAWGGWRAGTGGSSSHHRRLFGRSRPLRGEVLAAAFGDDDGVFVADAELAGGVDPRPRGDRHPGNETDGVPADDVRPLVAVEADAVAETVGEVSVAGTEAGVVQDLAGGGGPRLGFDAGAGG